MEPDELEARLAELERAETEWRAEKDRQILHLQTRVEIMEKFLTERYN